MNRRVSPCKTEVRECGGPIGGVPYLGDALDMRDEDVARLVYETHRVNWVRKNDLANETLFQ